MVFSELDVFKKCIGSKTTVTKLGRDILKLENYKSKAGSKAILKLYYKVWSGLTKFLRSQCSQQRCVYFSLLGSFCSKSHFDGTKGEEDGQVYVYIPDNKFLGNGDFKYSDDSHNKNPYSDTKIAKINVSPSSIAQVCETSSEAVSYVLKDIVTRSVSLSKEGVSVRLALKIGHLNIYPGKVLFEPVAEITNNYTTNGMNRLIGRRTHKSYGGGSKFMNTTMRSSVRTPGSAQSIYTGKSKRAHPSNPNPQNGSAIHPVFNKTMYDTFMGGDGMSASSKRDSSAKPSQKLPFPFVSGLVGGHSYTKPGKKVFFNKRPDHKEVLTHQLHQISYNNLKKKDDVDNVRSQDNELLRSIKFNMNKEEHKKRQLADMFKTQYKVYNDGQMVEQDKLKQLHQQSKFQDKYNFFPYTHGDEIEKKRITQKEQLTTELRERYSQANSENMSNGVRDAHSVIYNRTPEGRMRASMNKLNQSFTSGMYSPNRGGTENGDFNGMRSSNGKVPVKFVTAYPAFLTPSKHYPYRRLNDTHVESVMQSAVKRYEEDLRSKEQDKFNDAEVYKRQLQDNQSYVGKYIRYYCSKISIFSLIFSKI
jgi:hypothetical protein